MAGRGGCDRCDSEAVFELAEGSLAQGRKSEVLNHLRECPGCSERYEREKRLSECLSASFVVSGGVANRPAATSLCRDVAMSIPTRSGKARAAWIALALGLFLVAGFAMSVGGNSPVVTASGLVDEFWTSSSMLADTFMMFLSLVAPIILIAFAVGAALDLVIAAFVVAARRHSGGRTAHRAAETRKA